MLVKLYAILAFALTTQSDVKSDSVYVCNSSNAKKYHLRDHCRGLSSCTHKIVKISLEEAKKKGKDESGIEEAEAIARRSSLIGAVVLALVLILLIVFFMLNGVDLADAVLGASNAHTVQ